MSDGSIRTIPLYQVSANSNIIEAIGGCGKIVTLKEDFELNDTFTQHKLGDDQTVEITCLKVSFEGTKLISGDSKGRLIISDISTKQTSKKLKELVAPVANVFLFNVDAQNEESTKVNNNDKTIIRTIPTLKRVLAERNDFIKHELHKKLTGAKIHNTASEFELSAFLDEVKGESRWFTNFSGVSTSVSVLGASNGNSESGDPNEEKARLLEEKLKKMTEDYNELKTKHNDLYKEYLSSMTK
ncbi:unnamed protein product [Ambrosiozyma monospora]|uniref:Pre-rRNA-processing protein IPI3 n=1 Tax=Ambrosiozyma monospora TaxID=43982 RepID=A0A9W7DL16_AMBMO|nr:unnamed protein product [Ambrosiozyma monospora]